MPLTEQQIAVRFAGGIETKMDEKAVPAVKLLALENGVFTKAISIGKRNGYESLSRIIDGSSLALTDVRALGRRDAELLAFTSDRCFSHQRQLDAWQDAGPCVTCVATDEPAVNTGTAQTQPDRASSGGVTVFAWEDSRGGVWWSALDADSGRVCRGDEQLDSLGSMPRCVAVGAVIHIYWARVSVASIMVTVINPATPSSAVTVATLTDDLSVTNTIFDACESNLTGTPAVIAWAEDGGTNMRIGFVDQSGVLGSPSTNLPSVFRDAGLLSATSPIGITYRDDVIGVCVQEADNAIYGITYDGSGGGSPIGVTLEISLMSGIVPKRAVAAFDSDGTLWVAVDEEAVARSNDLAHVCSVTSGGGVGTPTSIRSVSLASRAFANTDGDVHAIFVHDTTYFNTYVALRLSDYFPVARVLAGSATGRSARRLVPSACADVPATSNDLLANRYFIALSSRERLAGENADQFGETSIREVLLDFTRTADNGDLRQTAQIGRGLYMAGACPLHYDGSAWTEQGFHFGPELIATLAAAGGSLTTSATYLYIAWYEWTDALGEVHRGPCSFGTSVSTGANTQVTLTLPTLRVTLKTNVRICVARSLPGDTSQMFRITSLDPTTSGAAANGYVGNNIAVDTVSFVDRMSDTTLRTQEPLYTNGGILSNDPTTPGSIIAIGKNRAFFNDQHNENVVRYSQPITEGFGLELAPELFLTCDPYGGPVTALAVMDDVVYAFKRDAIFAFGGDGPLQNGDSSATGFSNPQLVTSDVGCSAPCSIVTTPTGLMFKTSKGIYQLGRDRQVSYVGAPAEAFNAQSVKRANVMPARSQVVFLTDSGSSLLYDYLFGQWSTFTNHEGLDAVVVDDEYHYVRSDARVFRETIGAYSDAGVRITLRIETAWVHLFEYLQGWQRFWNLHVLGTRYSAHQLGIQYRTDYEDQWTDFAWLDATGDTDPTGWLTGDGANEIGVDPITGDGAYGGGAYGDGPYGGVAGNAYQWRLGLHANGQAIRFRFEDFEKDGAAGASFELTEMVITGGALAPTVRPFSAARSR